MIDRWTPALFVRVRSLLSNYNLKKKNILKKMYFRLYIKPSFFYLKNIYTGIHFSNLTPPPMKDINTS